jgi:glycosyltransferase involved in cell wall biosynthesis
MRHSTTLGAPQRSPVPVSVVINTLNRCDHLERTLVSLRDQTYQAFEVIVVNGPSTDGTDELLSSFEGSIRVAECGVASLGMSRNIGVDAAAGDIVAFIDDDAIPREDWLEKLVAPYSEPTVAAVGGPVFDIPLNRAEWMLCTCTRLGVPDTSSDGPIARYTGAGADPFVYTPGCNMSFRRKIVAEVGGFNQLLPYNYDDAEICSRVVDEGHRIYVLDDVLVRHFRAPNVARDSQQALLDPYPALYCRALFAMQCHQPVSSRDEIVAVIRDAAQAMIRTADSQLAEGSCTSADHNTFIARVEQAVQDGLVAGAGARPSIRFGPASRTLFRPYS